MCEDCRLAPSDKIIKTVCLTTQEIDPLKTAILIMKHPAVQIHGPEHHYLVSSVLLSTLRNLRKFKVDNTAFDEAIARGKRVLLGSCGLWGVCGAAAGVGIAISIVTKATMLSDKERSLSMQATSGALSKIAKIGGPRCCKASVFAAIEAAAAFFERELNIKFPSLKKPHPCYFKDLNKECLRDRCSYWR